MIVPEYTFRPTTRLGIVIERLAAESGHPAAAILSHIGACPYRNGILGLLRSFLFDEWERYDGETGIKRINDREDNEANWRKFSGYLLDNFGQHAACPNCEKPCHPANDGGPFIEVDRSNRS